MVIDTLTFSDKAEGWTSRWTYLPEWMMGLNSSFYSFKNGNLYKHDTNLNRTTFYNTTGGFSISTVINQSPTEIKMFKTLALDCTHPLNFVGYTDLDDAQMSMSQFVNKEGEWYSYMRRPVNDNNLQLISAQGVGIIDSIAGFQLTMDSEVSSASTGDLIISGIVDSNNNIVTNTQVGYVVDVVGNIISVSNNNPTPPTPPTPGFINAPTAGNYVYILKSSVAESYGTRGYFLNLTLSRSGSDATPEIELFAVSTAVFKSFP
jgi:hypothetical protein